MKKTLILIFLLTSHLILANDEFLKKLSSYENINFQELNTLQNRTNIKKGFDGVLKEFSTISDFTKTQDPSKLINFYRIVSIYINDLYQQNKINKANNLLEKVYSTTKNSLQNTDIGSYTMYNLMYKHLIVNTTCHKNFSEFKKNFKLLFNIDILINKLSQENENFILRMQKEAYKAKNIKENDKRLDVKYLKFYNDYYFNLSLKYIKENRKFSDFMQKEINEYINTKTDLKLNYYSFMFKVFNNEKWKDKYIDLFQRRIIILSSSFSSTDLSIESYKKYLDTYNKKIEECSK